MRACPDRVVAHSENFQALTTSLLALLKERYYRSDVVRESDRLAIEIVKGLFEHLMREPSPVPRELFNQTDLPLRVAAYIASLNDLSARRLAESASVIDRAPDRAPS